MKKCGSVMNFRKINIIRRIKCQDMGEDCYFIHSYQTLIKGCSELEVLEGEVYDVERKEIV